MAAPLINPVILFFRDIVLSLSCEYIEFLFTTADATSNPYTWRFPPGSCHSNSRKCVPFRSKVSCNIFLTVTPNNFVFRFAVNLQCGPNLNPRDDLAFHISPRFHERAVVRNSLVSGQWGSEERHGNFPFQAGSGFEILLLCDATHYKVFEI